MKLSSKPGFSDYLSEAFNANLDIKGMGSIPVNKLFVLGSFLLGFGNPGFWFLGAGLESLYLWFLSTNPRFQKYVQSIQLKEIQEKRSTSISQMISSLEPEFQKRLQRLNASLAEIKRLMNWTSDSANGFLNESKTNTLNQLPAIFLKLLKTKHLMKESLQRIDPNVINDKIKRLNKKLKAAEVSSAVAKSLTGNINLLQKRLDNLEKAKENEVLVEMELQRIENQIDLVREEIAIDSSPEGLSANIDVINSTLGETEDWMNTHSDFLKRLSGPDIDMEINEESFTPPPPRVAE